MSWRIPSSYNSDDLGIAFQIVDGRFSRTRERVWNASLDDPFRLLTKLFDHRALEIIEVCDRRSVNLDYFL